MQLPGQSCNVHQLLALHGQVSSGNTSNTVKGQALLTKLGIISQGRPGGFARSSIDCFGNLSSATEKLTLLVLVFSKKTSQKNPCNP